MTQTVAAALKQGAEMLISVADADPRREARLLLAHVLDCAASSVLTMTDRALSPDEMAKYLSSLAARQGHQPLSQIIGKRAFWEHEFLVTPDVLDPRPDTELLVELALQQRQAGSVLDLGTGSGCILCSVLAGLPEATGLGVDLSGPALAIAKKNAVSAGVHRRCEFRVSSWFEGVDGVFDLILSNPPYVTAKEYSRLDVGVRKWEPEIALTDGADGLQAYREIASRLDDFLMKGGQALFEHGVGQSGSVRAIFEEAGFSRTRSHNDLNGKDRVVSVER